MIPKPAGDISETLKFVSDSNLGMMLGHDLVFAITDSECGDFLGVCGCHSEDLPETPELGLWLKKAAHGKKIGRESIALLVVHIRTKVNTHSH